MGPRPFGRGRVTDLAAGRSWARLQWGRDLSVAEGCYARQAQTWNHLLQWGRDLSVAEGFPCISPPQNKIRASMGPRPFGRGRARPRTRWPASRLLQWGRDLSVAEGPSSLRSSRSRPSFNGAATFRSRKDHGHGAARRPARGLQWGRDLSVAEGRAFSGR